MLKDKRVVIWGDSLARGVVFDEERNRYRISPAAAVSYVAEKTGMDIKNRARMGMTAEAGLSAMRADLASGMEGDIAFLEFGGNDSDFDWRAVSEAPEAEHLPKTPLLTYENTMREMIELARSRNMRVVLCTLPPIISDRYFSFVARDGLNEGNILRWLGDKDKIYRYHERYSLSLARLARRYDARLLDLRAAFLEKWSPSPYFCKDGIHPNDKGQQLIAETVLRALA